MKAKHILVTLLTLCLLLTFVGGGVSHHLTVKQTDNSGGILLGKLGIVSDHDDQTVFCYLL